MSHKHEKVTSYVKNPDGSVKITSKSYYEELAHVLEEIEKPHHNLTVDTMKEAVEQALERITSDESPQVILTIKKQNGKIKLLERYITSTNDFSKFK
jgi:hypothetical protein